MEGHRTRRVHAKVLEGTPGRGATPRRALDQASLEQVRLVHVLDRVLLLADRDRQRRQADRPSAELLADRAEDLAIEPVEAGVVDSEQVERLDRHLARDDPGPAHLDVVAYPLEQPVGNARGAAASVRDRAPAAVLDRDVEQPRGPPDDRRQVVDVVVLEAMLDPEAVAERRGDQPGPGRRSDQGERGQRDRDHARPRALADRDRQAAVLHRRVEGLLERAGQAVDLVDEENGAGLERGQERRDVALALECGACGLHERDAELGGDDLRERRLAEPGRPGEQDVIECLAAAGGGLDRDRELILDRRLADEVTESAGSERAVEILVGQLLGIVDSVPPAPPARPVEGVGGVGGSQSPDGAHRRAVRRAWAIRSSGRSPSAPLSSSSTSLAE